MLFNKQSISKSQTSFNLKLNNHQKDRNKQNKLQADSQFERHGHIFNRHVSSC